MNVYVIAGPNGSGKTTFAREFLPVYANCPNFINADLIAQGLSPFSPQIAAMKAGRIVLDQIGSFASSQADFAFETTLSGRSYIPILKRLKQKGYAIHLFFLWIPSSQLALARIKDRVSEGGHDVPPEDVIRRFDRSIRNFFKIYKPLATGWMMFDNSRYVPDLIAKGKNGHPHIIQKDLFDSILRSYT